MRKAIKLVLALMAIGGFFSVGFADPLSHLGGGSGNGIASRP